MLLQIRDQPVDPARRELALELALVDLDQPRARHVDVVDLPVVADLAEPIADRLAVARRRHRRLHERVGARRAAGLERELRVLAAELRERRGVGARHQQPELLVQLLLLLRRRLLPRVADGDAGRALEVGRGQETLLDDLRDLRHVAAAGGRIGLHRGNGALDRIADDIDRRALRESGNRHGGGRDESKQMTFHTNIRAQWEKTTGSLHRPVGQSIPGPTPGCRAVTDCYLSASFVTGAGDGTAMQLSADYVNIPLQSSGPPASIPPPRTNLLPAPKPATSRPSPRRAGILGYFALASRSPPPHGDISHRPTRCVVGAPSRLGRRPVARHRCPQRCLRRAAFQDQHRHQQARRCGTAMGCARPGRR
ncbi:hypothetical protein EMIT0111MI5_20332 [Burkholderia sp. IT-111MI5]